MDRELTNKYNMMLIIAFHVVQCIFVYNELREHINFDLCPPLETHHWYFLACLAR